MAGAEQLARGARIFRMRCSQCHTLAKGEGHKTGPNLHGLLGRETGAAEGYNYSEANRSRGIVWNEEELDKYLLHPRGYIPGTKMVFQGVKDSQKRADLIAYLKAHA
mmetsp:Transcript_32861/g.86035  ORF Transcript_32861/g.86035 Transcript_32861/m.86035 type:complete len:107 (+) Transcript_32861:291-611(+)